MNEIDENLIKKQRSANFSKEEKEELIDIILQNFKDVIENKKTDSVSCRLKERAWKQVAIEFNAKNTEGHRNWKNLKLCYENIKKRTKKSYANKKTNIHKKGFAAFNRTERKLIAALHQEFLPLENTVDVENSDHQRSEILEVDKEVCERDYREENSTQIQNVAPQSSVPCPSSPTSGKKRCKSLYEIKYEYYTKRLKFLEIEHEVKLQNLEIEKTNYGTSA